MTSDNNCTLHIKPIHGSAAKRIKVSTDVSRGISCANGKILYIDSDWRAIIEHTRIGKTTEYVGGSKRGAFKESGDTIIFIQSTIK